MKISLTTVVLLLSSAIFSVSLPNPNSLALDGSDPASLELPGLEKRRGGGFGGGGRSGGFSSGGSSGGRSGSSTSRGGSGSSGGSSPRMGSTSNIGGTTLSGSGIKPAFGRGGAFYSGGARTPYRSGRVSPLGVTPFLLPLGALAFFPGTWHYGIWAYPYGHPYFWHNQTSKHNESLPVVCVCQEFSECGCDQNHNRTYFNDLFDGQIPKNTSHVRVAEVNGTEKIFINGTLPNGTTRANPNATGSGATIAQTSGYWVMAAVVVGAVWFL